MSDQKTPAPEQITISRGDGKQIAELLRRRADDIATFKFDLEKATGQRLNGFPGSVQLALDREILRLRGLADKACPPTTEAEDDPE